MPSYDIHRLMSISFSSDHVRRPGTLSSCLGAIRGRNSGRNSKDSRGRTNILAVEASTKIISGIVEQEILPSLRRVYRVPIEAATRDIRKLTKRLLDDPDGFQMEVTRQAVGGVPWHVLAEEMLAPVARDLGELWDRDLCDFFTVTEAVGRLQSLLRDAIGPQAGHDVHQPTGRILLAAAPGDTHTFGLHCTAGLCRDAGWATAIVGETATDPLAALIADLATSWYDVLGLSLACDVHSPALQQAMPAIRRASRNPALRVVVGGALVTRVGAEPAMWGADACLTNPAQLVLAPAAV